MERPLNQDPDQGASSLCPEPKDLAAETDVAPESHLPRSLGRIKANGASNYDSINRNKSLPLSNNVITSSHHYNAEQTGGTKTSSNSQGSRNDVDGRSNPSIGAEAGDEVPRTLYSYFNLPIPETPAYVVTSRCATKVSDKSNDACSSLQTEASFSRIMKSESKHYEYSISSTPNQTDLPVSRKHTESLDGQSFTASNKCNTIHTSSLLFDNCFHRDNLKAAMPSHYERKSNMPRAGNQRQEIATASQPNKPVVEALPSGPNFYVKQNDVLPLRTHQLASEKRKDGDFELTHNPYYTFLPEFNNPRASSGKAYEEYQTKSTTANNLCPLASLLPFGNLHIQNKFSERSLENIQNVPTEGSDESDNLWNKLSPDFANCIACFKHDAGGHYHKRVRVQTSPYFSIFRSLNHWREIAKGLEGNKSTSDVTFPSEMDVLSFPKSHSKHTESSDTGRHSNTQMHVYDIIAKKISSQMPCHTPDKSYVLGDEDNKNGTYWEYKIADLNPNWHAVNTGENETTGNISERYSHLLPPQDMHTSKQISARESEHQKDNEQYPMDILETVYKSKPFCMQSDFSHIGESNYKEDKQAQSRSFLEQADAQIEENSCALTPPSDFVNQENIIQSSSSNISLIAEYDLSDWSLSGHDSVAPDIGLSFTHCQYIGCPSCVASFVTCAENYSDSNLRFEQYSYDEQRDLSEKKLESFCKNIQSPPNLQRLTSCRSHTSNTKIISSGQLPSDINPSKKDVNFLNVKADSVVCNGNHESVRAKKQPSPRLKSPTSNGHGYLVDSLVLSTPLLTSPTDTRKYAKIKGVGRVGSPKACSSVNLYKQTHEQCKLSHSWSACSHISAREGNEPGRISVSRENHEGEGTSICLSSEGTANSREIRVQEYSESLIDDCPLVVVSWDEATKKELESQSGNVQEKQSYSLLCWSNSSELRSIRQTLSNLIKRIASTISSSAEILRKSQSQNFTTSTKISRTSTSAIIKQVSESKIRTSEVDNVTYERPMNEIKSNAVQQDGTTTRLKTQISECKYFSPNYHIQNKMQLSKGDYIECPHPFNDETQTNIYEKDIKNSLFYSQSMQCEKEMQHTSTFNSALPAFNSRSTLFTQQLKNNKCVQLLNSNNYLQNYVKQARPQSPTASSVWSMYIERPSSSDKKIGHSWWRRKGKSIDTFSKLFGTLAMFYLPSSDEDNSSDGDYDVISWNE